MSIGICVVAAGRRQHLARLLDGLSRQERRPDHVVIVVPDDDDDVAVADVPGVPGDDDGRMIEVVRRSHLHGAPLPIGAMRNLGVARLTTDQLVLLDVDCIPAPDLVARYAAILDVHPAAIACGPVRYLVRDWDAGPTEPADVAVLRARSDAPAARPCPAAGRPEVDHTGHDQFWSLSFGVDRRVWERIGGFDEAYAGYGAEDTDFGWRARRLGIPLVWFGGGEAYHQWHVPARDDRERIPELVDNARRFHRRWGAWPMTGWLTDLDERGWVRFDPARDELELT